MKYVSEDTVRRALLNLYGTAHHLLKIWFTLKQMGMSADSAPVIVDTQSPTVHLQRLFSFGSPTGEFFIPFAHTKRFLSMKSDASRSIIQTTIQRWRASGSVVEVDPTQYLTIDQTPDGKLLIQPGRNYPLGLGQGADGFATGPDKRVSIPATAFAVWYGRKTPIPDGQNPETFLLGDLKHSLKLSDSEFKLLFVDDKFQVEVTDNIISDSKLYALCSSLLETPPSTAISSIITETFAQHSKRLGTMITIDNKPTWLNRAPSALLTETVNAGAKAVLLYGPPRTGKTRAIDLIYPRNSADRTTIQIHDGWTYDHLIQGLQPTPAGQFEWKSGVLKQAIEEGKKHIVLEEINRTASTQALGEVFSLLENSYRGPEHGIKLRNGEDFFIPVGVVFFLTMNTIDQSTEEVDDALLGRFSAINFPPRIEDLNAMLNAAGLSSEDIAKVGQVFVAIQELYPLGHGYFADLSKESNIINYYVLRIRPVLANHLQSFRPEDLDGIDNLVDSLFASK